MAKHPKLIGKCQWKKPETYALITTIWRKDIFFVQINYLLKTTVQSRGRYANSIPHHSIPSPATFDRSLLYWLIWYPFPILLPNLSFHFSPKLMTTTLGSRWLPCVSTTQFVSWAKAARAKSQLSEQACSTDLHQWNCYIFLPNGRQQFSPSPSKGISFCYKAIHHPERWPTTKAAFP